MLFLGIFKRFIVLYASSRNIDNIFQMIFIKIINCMLTFIIGGIITLSDLSLNTGFFFSILIDMWYVSIF